MVSERNFVKRYSMQLLAVWLFTYLVLGHLKLFSILILDVRISGLSGLGFIGVIGVIAARSKLEPPNLMDIAP